MKDSNRPALPEDEFLEYEHYKPQSRPKNGPRQAPPQSQPTRPVTPHAPPESAELTRPVRTVQPAPPVSASPAVPAPAPAPVVPAPLPPAHPAPPAPPRPAHTRLTWATVAVFMIAGLLLISLFGFVGIRLFGHRGDQEVAALVATPTAPDTPTALGPAATPTVGLDIQPWDGKERFTVLLLGLDKRPSETGTAFRTDSMILVSLDPATHSVGILSIPRDLYVEIPRDTVVRAYYGLQRVNTGYYLGETVQPGYGPRLAMQTVQYNLGIRVNDYIVYDFEAVTAIVDAVGGIDINVPRDIVDPLYPNMNYGYDPLYIKAGLQHMDGALALKYARTRHDSSDIDRAERQQQVIYAMRDKVLSLNMLSALVVGAPGLWSQLSRHVKSGLTLDQIIRLVLYAKDIPTANIRHGVIDYQYVQPVTWNGAAVLVPNRYSIGPLLVQVFGSNYNQ